MCMGVSARKGKGESHCVYIMNVRMYAILAFCACFVVGVFCCRASKQASAFQSVYSKESLVFTSLRG